MPQTTVMEGVNRFKTVTYTPTCKYGFDNCVYDRAYIKATYPEWYEELIADGGIDCQCENGERYDCEDK